MRAKPPVIYHHKYSVQKVPELFFYSLFSLHKPWRSESDTIGSSKTYEEEFFIVLNNIPALNEAYSHKEQVRALTDNVDTALDTAVKGLGKSHDERECVDYRNGELNLGLRDFEDINSNQCLFERKEDLSKFVNTLNNDQLRIYSTVTSCLQHQQDHECGKCNCGDKKPLLMYISGYGGTGKSYLIKAIKGFLDIQ